MKKIKNLETAGRDGLGFGFRHLKKIYFVIFEIFVVYFVFFKFYILYYLIYFLKYFSTNFLNIKIFFIICLYFS